MYSTMANPAHRPPQVSEANPFSGYRWASLVEPHHCSSSISREGPAREISWVAEGTIKPHGEVAAGTADGLSLCTNRAR